MNITIHASFLPQDDPDAALGFYRDTLGFEVRNDVGYQGLRWITVGPAGQPGTSNTSVFACGVSTMTSATVPARHSMRAGCAAGCVRSDVSVTDLPCTAARATGRRDRGSRSLPRSPARYAP